MSENPTLSDAKVTTVEYLFPIVFGETWKSMTEEEAISFRNLLEAFIAGANMLREKFDGDVWKGHSDGTVPVSIQSVRAARTGDKPGKKAAEPTLDELLAKRLKK